MLYFFENKGRAFVTPVLQLYGQRKQIYEFINFP